MEKKPLVLINFKKVAGKQALLLVEQLNKTISILKDKYTIAIAIQPQDVNKLAKNTDLPLFIHDIFLDKPLYEIIDINFLKQGRVNGILINHPENKLSKEILKKNYNCAKSHNLKIIIASTDIHEALILNDNYFPDYIAIENAELIGKDISIRKKCPEIVKNAVLMISNRVLFGAGVRSSEDINYILKSGGSGVLLASVIINANDSAKALLELLHGE